jgi:Phytanoyl-CoA dioxygenase (PhyH)
VFLYTDPPSAVGFWFALEDCTKENGCLAFVPGSHLRCGIGKRFVRLEGGGTGFVEIGPQGTEPGEEEFKVEECTAGMHTGGGADGRFIGSYSWACVA